jgi:hypothetical protein
MCHGRSGDIALHCVDEAVGGSLAACWVFMCVLMHVSGVEICDQACPLSNCDQLACQVWTCQTLCYGGVVSSLVDSAVPTLRPQ